MIAALLALAAGGCGGTDGGQPTSGLSTASTGDVPTGSSTSAGGVVSDTSTTGAAVDGGDGGGESDAAGTRRDPIPLGEAALVGDWRVRVTGAVLEATQVVLDENMFNDPPESGSQYVLVGLEATYLGQESSTFWIDMLYTFVGDEGDTFDVAPVVVPESITEQGEVTNGGKVSGNLVFQVLSKQVAGGTLMLDETFAWDIGRVFFAVD